MTTQIISQIEAGCNELKITLEQHQYEQLADYVALLFKWNKVYNLTSVRDQDEMISRHLLDSLAILPHLESGSLLDVGSGGGLPGIPIAITKPEIKVTLLDTNSKKTRFLQQVKAELKLTNVHVVHARVEQAELPLFSMITARAFSTIEDIIKLAGHHCEPKGRLLLMKGLYPHDELVKVKSGFSLLDVSELVVPGCAAERHIVKLQKD